MDREARGVGVGLLAIGSQRFDSGGRFGPVTHASSVCVLVITIAEIVWTTPRYLDDTARCCEATPLLSSGIPCCGTTNAVLVRGQGTEMCRGLGPNCSETTLWEIKGMFSVKTRFVDVLIGQIVVVLALGSLFCC